MNNNIKIDINDVSKNEIIRDKSNNTLPLDKSQFRSVRSISHVPSFFQDGESNNKKLPSYMKKVTKRQLKPRLSISNLDIKNIVFDDVINILDDKLQKDDIAIEELNNITDYKKRLIIYV